MFTKHDSRNFFPWNHGIMQILVNLVNLVKLIRRQQVEMLLPWWTTSTWSRCTATLPLYYNLGKCRVTDEFFRAFATFILWNHIFGFPCYSSCEDLSLDVSITNVGLILTKPGRFFSRHTETRGTDRIQFRQFRTLWKIFTFLGFHGVVLVKTIPLMYQLLM